jgi:hypothetical protein
VSVFSAIGNVLGIAGHTVLRIGGTAIQLLAAGGGVLFGLDPRIAIVAWGVGKVLDAVGVHLGIANAPPVAIK